MPIVFALVLCLLVPSATSAQVLSESTFLSALDRGHPAMRVLERELAEAAASKQEASLWANPSIAADRESWGTDAQQTTVSLFWTPPLLGRLGPDRAAARHRAVAANLQAEVARMELRRTAREAYATWWESTERQRILSEQAARVRVVAERVRRRADSGEESGLTARRFELALLRVEAQTVRAAAGLAEASATLRTWLQEPERSHEPVRPDLPNPPDSVSVSGHPLVLARSAIVEAAGHALSGAGRLVASPILEFGWTWEDGTSDGRDGPVAGIALELPVFDRNQGDRTRARGASRAAHAELELETHRVREAAQAAQSAYRALRDPALRTWTQSEDLDAMIEAALAAFQAGERTDTDLLDALDAVLDARLGGLELYAAALAAHRTLEVAAGLPLTEGASR